MWNSVTHLTGHPHAQAYAVQFVGWSSTKEEEQKNVLKMISCALSTFESQSLASVLHIRLLK